MPFPLQMFLLVERVGLHIVGPPVSQHIVDIFAHMMLPPTTIIFMVFIHLRQVFSPFPFAKRIISAPPRIQHGGVGLPGMA